ncbi:MAG: hypothetical protein ACO2ZZ_04515 [Cyclobacteriaceae bacterium]
MNTRKLFSIALGAVMTMIFSACENNFIDDQITKGDNSFDTRDDKRSVTPQSNFSLKTVRNRLTQLGIGGHLAASFASNSSRNGRLAGGPMTAMAETSSVQSEVCFRETFTEYADGSYEWIAEFLGGCGIEGENLTGTITGRGKYQDNAYTDTLTFNSFGDSGWMMNGTEINSGTFESMGDEESAGDDYDEEDWYEVNATYTFSSDLQISETYEGETYDFTLVSNGEEVFTPTALTTTIFNERAEGSDGEVYTSEVTTPLVIDFNCEIADAYWIPVSGVENAQWVSADETWTESIDYGDGSCDTMATVTENGASEEVDLADEWDYDEGEEDEEDEEDEDEAEDNSGD